MNKKDGFMVKNMALAGIFAAIITLVTAYFLHIPNGANGGYLHLGDAVIYLAAALLPKPYAMAAAAIGGGMADLLTAPMWAPATMVIKLLLVLPFSSKGPRIINLRNGLATLAAAGISCGGYFLAEYILFGSLPVAAVLLGELSVQSLGSAIAFFFLGAALDKTGLKNRI